MERRVDNMKGQMYNFNTDKNYKKESKRMKQKQIRFQKKKKSKGQKRYLLSIF